MITFARRFLKKIGKLVIAIALCFGAACILLRLGPINDLILGFIKLQVEETTGWSLHTRTMDRVSPFALRLRDVELSSPTGSKILAERISLTFAPYQLLLGKIVFPSISLRDVTIVMSPHSEFSAPLEPPSAAVALAPLGIDIQSIRITNLEVPEDIGTDWLPADATLPKMINLTGHLRLNALFGTAEVELNFEDASKPEYETICFLSAYQSKDQLRLDARVAEDNHGLIHGALGAATSYSVEIFAHSILKWEQPPYPSDEILGKSSAKGGFSIFCTRNEDDDPEPAPGWLGDATSIEGQYHWAPWEGLKLRDVTILSQLDESTLRLQGDLHIDRQLELHNAAFKASVDNLTLTNRLMGWPSQGLLDVQGTVQGPWIHPVVDISLRTIDLTIHGKHLGDLQMQAQAHCSSEAITGSAALACLLGTVKTNSTFDVLWDYGPMLTIKNLHAQSASASLRGNLQVWLASLLVDGQIEGETGDLSWLFPNNSGFIRGSGSLSLDLHSVEETGTQNADIQAEINNLRLTEVVSDYMHIEAHLEDILERPFGQLKIAARELHTSSTRLKDLAIETHIPADSGPWSYRLQANGRWESKFRLLASGELTPSLDAPTITLDQCSGRLRGHPFQLTSPVDASWVDQTLSISPIDLKVGQGQLLAKASYRASQDANLSVKVSQIPIELMQILIPQLPIQGNLSGELEAHGPPENPTATLRIDADQVIVASEGLLNVPPLRAKIEGTVEDSILKASADIKGIGDRPVTASAVLPVRLSLLPFHLDIIPDKPLSAKIDANGEVSPLLQLLVSDTSSLTGQARVALAISGTYQAPLVNGSFDLRNCTYEGLDTGCVLRNIQAQFEGRGNELVLTNATADDGRQGTITAGGVVHLDPTQNYPFDIGLNLTNTLVLSRDFVQGAASGQLHMIGDLNKLALRGDLTANTLTITIPKELPTPAASLDITFVNSPKLLRTNNPSANKESSPLELDIAINVPARAFIRSEDLLSEWAGRLHLTGNSYAPTLYGELRVIRGDYRVNGKMFQLDKGTITFAGDLEKKTSLYVVASQDIDRYSIEAVLRGPIRSPQLNLRSNPHMSQREILSWLIFGRGLNDVTRLENDQAGQAAVDLSKTDQSNTSSMMARLRRLGIDRIDFNNDDLDYNNMSVKVGKYLCRDVFISLNRGITSDSNSVCIEANLIKHVKLQAQVDDEATGGMRLMWKHDY